MCLCPCIVLPDVGNPLNKACDIVKENNQFITPPKLSGSLIISV